MPACVDKLFVKAVYIIISEGDNWRLKRLERTSMEISYLILMKHMEKNIFSFEKRVFFWLRSSITP